MKKSWLFSLLLVGYSILLIKVMILKDVPLIRVGSLMLNFGGTHEGAPNFIPFKTILFYLSGGSGWLIAGINIIGNILLLVPLGFLLPFVFKSLNWKTSFLLAVLSALSIEGLQSFLHIGIFDIDDVILNGFGFMIGYWKFLFLPSFLKLMKTSTWSSIAFIMTILIVLYFLVTFYQNDPVFKGPDSQFRKQHFRSMNHKNSVEDNADDLCGGTGGTGQIIAIQQDGLTIKRKDGENEILHITNKTVIKTSKGDSKIVDLKIGDRVTVVVGLIENDPKAASLILLCNAKK